ncbi:PREDICTED: UDP-glycosyltransferase 83A1-like isoform X1 [Lupinus angustifolius]|uniref:UDP-glycosyltransferase 83A1-like isoform X1 n=1 Tax=Lupinus angustifolius TaxID=3871 RepID=UPI00092F1D27|nr:PREDICTED: UDP-glycosyltransferase 83A1-like isoform X1 [Lupinus angustifolius]
MSKPHILVIPYPAQGHVIPLMELSNELVKHGIKVTFVNTDFTHKRIMKALQEKCVVGNEIQLVSIPDGLQDGDDRNDLGKLTEALFEVMPKKLEMLIEEINKSLSNKITCIVADGNLGWALEVSKKMGIRTVAFWPASASLLILFFSLQKLIDDGTIDSDGTPAKDTTIQLSPMMPAMRTTEFTWACIGDMKTTKIMIEAVKKNNEALKVAEWVICNSTYNHEAAAFTFAPEILPIGPLQASNHIEYLAGNFWSEDSTCLNWLDQQPPHSVIYVAFGSFTIFDHKQLQELAHGLEHSNKPFLWVVRSDINNGKNEIFLKEFEERVSPNGKVVQWAPQKKVLGHPSIACFLSHCGWNSTMEGTTNGVPFLCWPYFADQFINETYICDIWKVGLRLDRNSGIITREDITYKIKQLLHDEEFQIRALKLKESAINSVKEGGSSNKNFKNFIDWIKACV